MNETAQQILDIVPVGALATVNEDGSPLVTPLHFARFDTAIVWVSDASAQHSQNVDRTGRAQFVVWNEQKQAVYLDTTVIRVAENDESAVRATYAEKLGGFMPKFANPQFYRAELGTIDENSTTGNWLHYIA